MIEWISFIPTVLVTVGVLALPGLALGLTLRIRGWWLMATAAPLSVSLVVVASIFAGWFSIPWTAAPVLVLTAVAVIAAFCWRRWVGPGERSGPRRARRKGFLPGIVGLAAGAVPIAIFVGRGMGDPSRIAQRYDNFFHINAIQYVLDTQNGSPFAVGSMTAPGNLLFYPSGWHSLGSLVVQLSGGSVPAASNAVVLVLAALVWPVSIILLARTLFGGSALVTVAAGALAAATPAFPYLPLHYGPLYPLFLGLSLAPVALATLIRVFRPHRAWRRQDTVLLLVLLIPGIAVSHPGALLAVLALGTPALVVLGWWLWRARRSVVSRVWITVGAIGLATVGALVLTLVRPPASEIYWPVTGTLPTAIGEIVSAAVFGYPVALFFAVLTAVGVVTAFIRPTYSRTIALGMGFVGAVLYVVVAGSPSETVRLWLSGPWYNNAPRLASIWAIAAVPLAAAGAAFLGRWARRSLRRYLRPNPSLVMVIFTVLLVTLSQGSALRQAAADIEFVYGDGAGTDGPILSAGEYELLLELDDFVPEDAVIAGNPWTGTSFAYGISGHRVLMPHLLMDESAAANLINESFASEGGSAAMCAALAKTGTRYILDFDGGTFMDAPGGFEGVSGLEESRFVELVASEPGARLYRITECELEK